MASILIVEDHENLSLSLKECIEKEGYQIYLAENLKAAREKMEDFVGREIPHYFVKNVYQVPPGLAFITHALKLGFRFTECRS